MGTFFLVFWVEGTQGSSESMRPAGMYGSCARAQKFLAISPVSMKGKNWKVLKKHLNPLNQLKETFQSNLPLKMASQPSQPSSTCVLVNLVTTQTLFPHPLFHQEPPVGNLYTSDLQLMWHGRLKCCKKSTSVLWGFGAWQSQEAKTIEVTVPWENV